MARCRKAYSVGTLRIRSDFSSILTKSCERWGQGNNSEIDARQNSCHLTPMSLREYFEKHPRLKVDALKEQKVVNGNHELAERLAADGDLVEFAAGEVFIDQGENDKFVYFILSGSCEVIANGRSIAKRGPSDHVGEMAIIQPTQKRSASCVASDSMLALKISGEKFEGISSDFPQIYKPLARELARRLLERNNSIPGYRDRVRVFVICSVEALEVARAIQDAFEHDPFHVVVWTDGVFKVATYPIEALESELANSDFAIAIAHSDDRTFSRDADWPTPRDNVIFELGMFLGRLGRNRAILMEPREEKVKLPSDLTGITTIAYTYPDEKEDISSVMAPACNKLRKHIQCLGPFNG